MLPFFPILDNYAPITMFILHTSQLEAFRCKLHIFMTAIVCLLLWQMRRMPVWSPILLFYNNPFAIFEFIPALHHFEKSFYCLFNYRQL